MADTADERRRNLASKRRYWTALGEFVEAYAYAESMLLYFVIATARLKVEVGNALLPGARTDVCIDHIRRLWEITPTAPALMDEINDALSQLRLVSKARNSMIHLPPYIHADGTRMLSNAAKVHSDRKVDTFLVSVETLQDLIHDTHKISMHLLSSCVSPQASFDERARIFEALKRAWRYKSPQDRSTQARKQE